MRAPASDATFDEKGEATTDLQVARGLGWFSLGIGLTEMAAPRWLGKTTGIGSRPKLLRTFGAREFGTGVAVLSQRNPSPALWGRFAGDLLDLAFLSRAFKNSFRRNRVGISIAMVLGVTAVDLLYAWKLSRPGQWENLLPEMD